MGTIKIRKANLADLSKLAALFDQYRVFYQKETDIRSAETFLEERIINKESVIFIAELEDQSSAGFTQLYPVFSSTRMKRLWLLNDLYVNVDYRGQGISKMLIDAAKNLCKETQGCAITLETEKSNLIGNQLYPSVEFKLSKDHNFYEWTCN